MFDYYKEFKPVFEDRLGKLAKKRKELTKQITETKKKIATETDKAERVKKQIEKLQALAGQSLVEDEKSYEKFKTSLRKRILELDVLNDMIKTLQNTVLPNLQDDFAKTGRTLSGIKKVIIREKIRPLCDERIKKNFQRFIIEEEYDNCTDTLRRLCADYGENYEAGQSELKPGLKHNRLDKRLPGLIRNLTADELIERDRKAK